MPNYYVLTHSEGDKSRTLVITADFFEKDGDAYNFYVGGSPNSMARGGVLVASVPIRRVFAITETEKAFQADWIDNLAVNDEPSDVCIGCEYKDLLESEAFWDRVWDVVEAYHEPDDDESAPPETVQ